MRLYSLFYKWKVYEFCLFEAASFQKQDFQAHSGMAKFFLFGVSFESKLFEKIHCRKYNGYLNLTD